MFKKITGLLTVVGFLLTACSGQGTANKGEVNITLTDFGINSSVTEFTVGTSYRFTVTNNGLVEHEFMIMPPLTEDSMGMSMDMGTLDEMALAMIAASDLQPGDTASFDFTFTEPAASGDLEFACHTPGHYEANMRLGITVK